MGLKEQVELLKEHYDALAESAKQYLEINEKIKALQSEIKSSMDEEGLDSFNCALGKLELVSKDTFKVPKELKDEMIAYFKADPNLAPMVKVKEDVNFQTAQAEFRRQYNDTNEVPPFVTVETYTVLKPKFNDFKEQKMYLDKIKKKQSKETAPDDDAE